MKMGLKCPVCKHTYLPNLGEDDPSREDEKSRHGFGKIFRRRYGTDWDGRIVECIVCCSCDSISYVQISKIKFLFSLLASIEISGVPFAVISPYKLCKRSIGPVKFLMSPYAPWNNLEVRWIRDEVNKLYDTTNEAIPSILEDFLNIPPHIFEFLSETKLLTIDNLGLRYKGKYCNDMTQYGRRIHHYSSDKYTVDEMTEMYDIHDRNEQIKHNQNPQYKPNYDVWFK